ncbi:MAG TPA: glycosyltransferase, partial [Gammaproteobacteria bacterium]
MAEDRQSQRVKLGLIAPEFPPSLGGMGTLAEGFARELARTEEVIVFAPPATGEVAQAAFRLRRSLRDSLSNDLDELRGERVDAWLALNAGVIPLAPYLEAPFFVYVHGSDFLNPWISYGSACVERIRMPYLAPVRKALRRRALRRSMNAVEHVFTNSRNTADLAAEALRIDPATISICPPGVDDKFFQQPTAPDGRSLRILTVTRLTKHSARNNVDGVLRAIALLDGQPPVSYTVVGEGDDAPRLHGLARSLGICDRVRFRGRLSDAELLACYRNTDLFILAAKADRRDTEGFGIVYLEASASGVPSLCSRAGGAVDAVIAGENGILINDSTPETIAVAIRRFSDAGRSLSPKRVRAVAESYRWPTVGARLRENLLARIAR